MRGNHLVDFNKSEILGLLHSENLGKLLVWCKLASI